MESKEQNLSISGRIVIAERIPAFRGGTAHIYLEDTTIVDAESSKIAEAVVEKVSHDGRATEIFFRMEIPDKKIVSPKNFYSVRVWIDVDSDGKPSSKDLFSDRSYRVLTHGFANSVEIKIGF